VRRAKAEPAYRNQSAAAPEKPRFEPVVCPAPVFESVSDKLQWEYAVESTPRRDREDVIAWLDRVRTTATGGSVLDLGKTEGA
jgi:predicted component of type VI protein secretion system